MSLTRLPKLLRWALLITLVNVCVFSLFRVVFWWYFSDPQDPVAASLLQQVFYVGFKYDLRLSLFVLTPLLLLAWHKRLSPFTSTKAFYIWVSYLALAMLLILLFYFLNFGHYAYLKIPLDATALRFLENLQTSAVMVWQSYPVIWLFLGLSVLTLLYGISIAGLAFFIRDQQAPALGKKHKFALTTVCFFVVIFGIYGKLSWYPLRWSDAFTFGHPFASAVTVNPVLYSLTTLKNKNVEYDLDAVKASYGHMVDYLGITSADAESLSFQRLELANKYKSDKPNIVVVILESFANYKSSLSGNPLDPTPAIQEIAGDGIYFDRFYTPHAGTARSVFTTISGLPDVEKVKTSTRNPLVVNQHSIASEFKGYEKFYFLGGSASWGNIRGLLSNNIKNLNIYEEGSYVSPRIDVWGISDLNLFEEANQVLAKVRDKPFFAVIQTSGNHRPYTIPDDRRGFELVEIPDKKVQRYGFHSAEEYNSFRFMDHSVGFFIEQARKERYFNNTVFVFYGDHGINYNPGEHSTKAEGQLNLGNIHVPLVFYAPKLIPGGKTISKLASEVDVMATLAGLALDSYRNTTMGRDLFNESFDQQRYAFTAMLGGGMRLGLISQDYYYTMLEDGSNKNLYLLQSETPRDNRLADFPDTAEKMERISRSIYETTRYMRYNNPRLN